MRFYFQNELTIQNSLHVACRVNNIDFNWRNKSSVSENDRLLIVSCFGFKKFGMDHPLFSFCVSCFFFSFFGRVALILFVQSIFQNESNESHTIQITRGNLVRLKCVCFFLLLFLLSSFIPVYWHQINFQFSGAQIS